MSLNKVSCINFIVLVAAFFTILKIFFPGIIIFGMHAGFLLSGEYYMFPLQVFSSQFLHGGILHLLFNAIFLLYFGNLLEERIGYNKMFLFFLLNSLFVSVGVLLFSGGITVGISGFCLAVLTYYTMLLHQDHNPEYKGGVTAIVINILIGLSPGISFVGHLAGMIFGALFFLIQKRK